MRVTEHIHALRIPFKIPVAPEKMIERVVYAYIIFGDTIALVDSGVMGAEERIFDYIHRQGRDPREISLVILSHSHPDHIGAVKAIRAATGCRIAAHRAETDWIEDTERQFGERPVPGFHALVGGPVAVDRPLADGEIMTVAEKIRCRVMHTPGHSRGSIALFFDQEKALLTGDALPLPDDLPIYEDVELSVYSIKKLKKIKEIETLLSSWEAPVQGYEKIEKRIDDGLSYLRRIHEAVQKARHPGAEDMMALCRQVVGDMGLPPFAANPLVARAFASHLAVMGRKDPFAG